MNNTCFQNLVITFSINWTLLNVISKNWHTSLHHFSVFSWTNTVHDMFMFRGHVKLLEIRPHSFRNSDHVVYNYLIEKPYISSDFWNFKQVSVQQTKCVFNKINSFFCEDEFHNRKHISLKLSYCFALNWRLNDSSNSFKTSSCC